MSALSPLEAAVFTAPLKTDLTKCAEQKKYTPDSRHEKNPSGSFLGPLRQSASKAK
jgi:hypothetical protein